MEIQNGGWRLGGCKLKPPHALFSCSLHHALEVDSRFGSQTLRNLKKSEFETSYRGYGGNKIELKACKTRHFSNSLSQPLNSDKFLVLNAFKVQGYRCFTGGHDAVTWTFLSACRYLGIRHA